MDIELIKKRFIFICDRFYKSHGYSKDISHTGSNFSFFDTAGLCTIESDLFDVEEYGTPIRIMLNNDGTTEHPFYTIKITFYSADTYLSKDKYWFIVNLLCEYFVIKDVEEKTALYNNNNQNFFHCLEFVIKDIK